MKILPSIFNDVLSPVTPGPSSSNTAGVYRIVYTLAELLGNPADALLMEMRTDGGFADTFYGMQSDLAAVSGALGLPLESESLSRALGEADARGLSRRFVFSSAVPREPSESALVRMGGPSGSICALASSLGGGAFAIREVGGFCTDITGRDHCVLMALGSPSDADAAAQGAARILRCKATVCKRPASALTDGGYAALVEAHMPSAPDAAALAALGALRGVCRVMRASRRYPFAAMEDASPAFATARELAAYAGAEKKSLFCCAQEYERALTGLDGNAQSEYAGALWDITLRAVDTGLNGVCFTGVTQPAAGSLPGTMPIALGAGDLGIRAALAVMETSSAHGTVVCMPTGGSSGVVPGVILGASGALGLKREAELRALAVAGLVGAFFFETNYSGSLGCQAEVGIAAAMAAAAAADMRGADASTALEAAAFAVQSLLGLVCDPVAGFVQLPCFIRNMTGVTTALTAANAALCGMKAGVPLDEMAAVLLDVGKRLRSVNPCGTCNAPSAKKLGCALSGG